MKRNFTRIFRYILIGSAFLIASAYLEALLWTLVIILRENEQTSFYHYLSLCGVSHVANPDDWYIFMSLHWTLNILISIGIAFILFPYVVYGLLTMYTILWRLWEGKTGYKTHFRNPLFVPLLLDEN